MRLEVFKLNIEESITIIVGTAMSQDVIRSQTTLATRWHEDDDRLGGRVLYDCQICRFGHSDHERWEVWDIETLQMNIHIERSSTKRNVSTR